MTTQVETPVRSTLELARERHHGLVERLQAGDETVDQDEFARSEASVRFAGAQHIAAQQRAEREADRQRQERIAVLVREALERNASPTIERATAALAKALDQFAATAASYNQRHTEIWNELAGLAPLPLGVEAISGGGDIATPAAYVRKVQVEHVIATTAREVIQRHFSDITLTMLGNRVR